MNKKIDKRAQVELPGSLLDFLAYFIFIFAVILFVAIFTIQSNAVETRIKEVTMNIESSKFVSNYLRTPVEVDGEQTNMAHLIALWDRDDGYEDLVKDKTSEIINSFYEGELSWKITVDEKSLDNYRLAKLEGGALLEGETYVPLLYGEAAKLTIEIRTDIIEEGTWCFFAWQEKCDRDLAKLCKCERVGYDRLLWTDCKICVNGCNPEGDACR